MYLLCFYVPQSHLDSVKESLFNAGAGKFEDYSHACWQTLGEGQFMPLAGSKPLKQSHPYEEPAYQVIKCENF